MLAFHVRERCDDRYCRETSGQGRPHPGRAERKTGAGPCDRRRARDAGKGRCGGVFCCEKAALDAKLPGLLAKLRPDAILWVAYPKLTSALAGDLSRDGIREWAPSLRLDTVSQIAIDEDWSALRLKRV
jgi:hypothetical protein